MMRELNGWRFTNFPQPLSREAYDRAREEFLEYYQSVEGVSAIYRIGSVSYPGLSDLDFIVVLDDEYRTPPGVQYGILPFRRQTQYALYHPQIFMARRLFPNLPFLLPVFEMEHLVGEKCDPIELPSPSRPFSDTVFLCESLVTDFAWGILGYAASRKVDLRMAQAKLNLLPKNTRILERLVGKELPEAKAFPEKVVGLRGNWFSRSPEENCRAIVELLPEAGKIVSRMAGALHSYVLASGWPDSRLLHGSEGVYRYENVRVHFRADKDDLRVEPARDGRPVRIHAPLTLMLPLLWFASGSGPVSRYVRHHFESPPPAGDLFPNQTVHTIVQTANDHCHFLKSRGIRTGHFRYFGYRGNYAPGVRTLFRLAAKKLEARTRLAFNQP